MNVQPEFRANPGFTIVGIQRYTDKGIDSIREAWEEFTRRSAEFQNLIEPRVCYGFEDYSRDFVMQPGQFPKYYYTASWEVTSLDDIPAGMVGREVPAANYAVFSYRGPISGLPAFFKYIYEEWMPTSGYQMDPTKMFDFERYAEPMTDMENVVMEVWVAVVQK